MLRIPVYNEDTCSTFVVTGLLLVAYNYRGAKFQRAGLSCCACGSWILCMHALAVQFIEVRNKNTHLRRCTKTNSVKDPVFSSSTRSSHTYKHLHAVKGAGLVYVPGRPNARVPSYYVMRMRRTQRALLFLTRVMVHHSRRPLYIHEFHHSLYSAYECDHPATKA